MTQEKMFLTNQPALPARCAVCYNDAKSNRVFVDFGASLDFYGAILICDLCMVNAAKLFGMETVQPPVDTTPMENEIYSLQQKVKALESLVRVYVGDSSADLSSLFGPGADLSLFEGIETGPDQISTV